MTNDSFNIKNKLNSYLLYYLVILFFFSVSYLIIKHDVGNDSTISEWLINYSGGFTKRGLIGQISIYIANFFNFSLREAILVFQIFTVLLFYVSIFIYVKDQYLERYFLLALFSPILLLYPVAEIEVLARKELFIYILFILHCSIPVNKIYLNRLSKLIIFPLSMLIWEPVIFFILFWIFIDLLKSQDSKNKRNLYTELLFYIPAILLAINFIFFPLTPEEHTKMSNYLNENFNEICYMSCALLNDKSTLLQQFQGNMHAYSFEVFFRYTLIICIGFGPIFFIFYNSKFNLIKKNSTNTLSIVLVLLSPVLFLFAMGYDWGRWVHISYTMTFIFFIFLKKKNFITINYDRLKKNKLNLITNKKFIIIFIIFCFTWNPKTVITGDVASFPAYRIPYKLFKTNAAYKIPFKLFKNNFNDK